MLLPFMESLQPRTARAATGPNTKRFIYVGSEHGGGSFANQYGTQGSTGSTPVEIWSGQTARSATLALSTSGSNASLTPILTAPTTQLTPAIVAKMNLIRGIDFANAVGHQDGAHLGNNASQVGDRAGTLTKMVTIDQVMAYSPSFYGTSVPRVRSINIGGDRALSWTYTNPSARTGVQALQRFNSSLALFKSIFGTGGGTAPVTPVARPLIIDRVLQNYTSLRQSNRRLSAGDRRRLDDHVARLTQLQQQLTTAAQPLTCGSPTAPADNAATWGKLYIQGAGLDEQNTYYKLMADVLLAAFSCDASRIAVYHVQNAYSTYQGDWHQDIAHQDEAAAPQQTLSESYQRVFEKVFLYLANGLNSISDPNGGTALDNTLLVWGQESGYHTHDPYALPLVTAGSAGGYFKTGLFVDYRNQVASSQNYQSDAPMADNWAGLIYPQFLATALYSMGIAQSEWTQPNSLPGYGDYKPDPEPSGCFRNSSKASSRNASVFSNAGRPLPIITNG